MFLLQSPVSLQLLESFHSMLKEMEGQHSVVRAIKTLEHQEEINDLFRNLYALEGALGPFLLEAKKHSRQIPVAHLQKLEEVDQLLSSLMDAVSETRAKMRDKIACG